MKKNRFIAAGDINGTRRHTRRPKRQTLAQAIDRADERWQHGWGENSLPWEDWLAHSVILWFRDQEETPTDIVRDYHR